MEYLILDYCKPIEKKKSKKEALLSRIKYGAGVDFGWFEERSCIGENNYNRLVLEVLPKELALVTPKALNRKWTTVLKELTCGSYCRILDAQPGMIPYIPRQLVWVEDRDEIFLDLLRVCMGNWCVKEDTPQQQGNSSGRNARLLFLDDGTRRVDEYIRYLSLDWNYVTVYSKRHEELEYIYRTLYEEEGLMIQCMEFDFRQRMQYSCEDRILVVDLTSDWKGIHRMYPEGAYVLDVTFSHEKKEYLKAKAAKLSGYIQICSGEMHDI